MSIEAIQPAYSQRRSVFTPIAQGLFIGSGAGVAAKYFLPLTQEEKSTQEYKDYKKTLKKVKQKKIKIETNKLNPKNIENIDEVQIQKIKNQVTININNIKKNYLKHIKAYDHVTKYIRPTGFFVATGAILGGLIGMINHITKTEIR